MTIFAKWVSGYMFFGSGISKIALVLDYDLLEAIYSSLRGQNYYVSIFAPLVSKYRFFGSRILKTALVLDYDLSEAIYWPPKDL